MHCHRITAHAAPGVTSNAHDHSHDHGHSHHTNAAHIHRCGHSHQHDHTDDASRDQDTNHSPAGTPIPTGHDCRLCDMIAGVVGVEGVETLTTHLFDLSHRRTAIEGERAPHLLSLTLRAGRGPPHLS